VKQSVPPSATGKNIKINGKSLEPRLSSRSINIPKYVFQYFISLLMMEAGLAVYRLPSRTESDGAARREWAWIQTMLTSHLAVFMSISSLGHS
jgi:hypothetical protein